MEDFLKNCYKFSDCLILVVTIILERANVREQNGGKMVTIATRVQQRWKEKDEI